jgi:hypothetical protein
MSRFLKISALLWSLYAPLIALGGTASRAPDRTNEAEPFFQAAQFVRPSLLNGPNYRVIPEVQVHGYMANFLIDTPYGPLNADSVQMLAIRINEIPAIEVLDRASRSGAFAHAVSERGKKSGNAIVKVITHPIDSITGLPMGVVRYFGKQIDTWSSRAQSAGDHSQRVFENKGDPFRAPDGPMTVGRDPPATSSPPPAATSVTADGIAADASEPEVARAEPASTTPPTAQKKSHAWYSRAGNEIDREAKRYLKYNQERNEMAKFLGIDPNTSNPYVRDKLDTLGWAAVWGNFSASKALGDITGTTAAVIADSTLVDDFVLTHTPDQVRDRNEKNLTSVCSDEFGIRQFSRRGGFNDTLRTQLISSLQKLKPASGCNELLELGAATRGEIEARYLVNALAMIRRRAPDATGGKLVVAGAALVYVAPDGKLVLPLPVDYLSWSHDIGEFFDRPEFARNDKTVLIGGEASMLMQKKLTERGWNLILRAPFDGAPSYEQGEFAHRSE